MTRFSQLGEDFGSVSGTRCRYKVAKAHRDKGEKDAESDLTLSLCPSVLFPSSCRLQPTAVYFPRTTTGKSGKLGGLTVVGVCWPDIALG
jgi:hypothetical protein